MSGYSFLSMQTALLLVVAACDRTTAPNTTTPRPRRRLQPQASSPRP